MSDEGRVSGIIAAQENPEVRILANRCGARLASGMKREDWRKWIDDLEEGSRQLLWVKADSYAFAHLEFGAAYIREMSPEGFAYRSKLIHTANLFPKETRNPHVPFTHYLVCYEYGVSDQKAALSLIEKCALNSWTKTRLKEEIRSRGSIKDQSFRDAAEPGYDCFQRAVTFLRTHPPDNLDPETRTQLYERVKPLKALIEDLESAIGI